MATHLFSLSWLKTQTGRDLDSLVDSSTLALGEKSDGTQGAFSFFQGIKNFFKGVTAIGSLTSSGKLALVNTSTGEINYTTVGDLATTITTTKVQNGNSAPVSSSAVAGAITSASSTAVTAAVTQAVTNVFNKIKYTQVEFEFNNGYTVWNHNLNNSNFPLFIQNLYVSGGVHPTFTIQYSSANAVNIYARVGGASPANGTTIRMRLLYII